MTSRFPPDPGVPKLLSMRLAASTRSWMANGAEGGLHGSSGASLLRQRWTTPPTWSGVTSSKLPLSPKWLCTNPGTPLAPEKKNVGPRQLNGGSDSREKSASRSPTRATTSRFPGSPKLLWRRATASTRPASVPNGAGPTHGSYGSSLSRRKCASPPVLRGTTSSKSPRPPNTPWIIAGLPETPEAKNIGPCQAKGAPDSSDDLQIPGIPKVALEEGNRLHRPGTRPKCRGSDPWKRRVIIVPPEMHQAATIAVGHWQGKLEVAVAAKAALG